MVEIVNHAWGHDTNVMTLAYINEDVGLNLCDIPEKAIYILRRDQTNLVGTSSLEYCLETI